MKIVFDIHHPADVNFFKNAINNMNDKNIEIKLTVRQRGKLVKILQKELPLISFKIIGKHQSGFFMKILIGIKRELDLLYYFNKEKFDVGVAFGPEICYVSKIVRKPSIVFGDDYEYKLTFYLSKFAATYFYIPDSIPSKGSNIYNFKGIKELAYLHPKYFKPNRSILENYNLKPNKYVFIREISTNSLNYIKKSSNLHEIIEYFKQAGFQIVLSLENEALISRFEADCIILKEPVNDIYSLMSFAALMISSGDTMARESCLVGTPSIYTGGREMLVNNELIENECLFKCENISEIKHIIKYITDNDLKNKIKKKIDYKIKYQWDDITKVIVENIMSLNK